MTKEPIYHRWQSDSQTPEDAKKQIASQEMWGGPCGNFMRSDIPKVKAYTDRLPTTKLGVEFITKAKPDGGSKPGLAYWSGEARVENWPENKKGVWTQDWYAKIRVQITLCNQLDEG